MNSDILSIEEKTFAPVAIPTLNRYEHLKRCLESLERCTGADKTDIYVGLDYPPAEKYKEGWEKVDNYLREKEENNAFHKLLVTRHPKNYGAIDNIEFLYNQVKESYDSYILTEDDNEFSPNFLEYMNKGLDKYKDDDRVFSICGYNYPVDMNGYNKNVYCFHGCAAWGVGKWANKFPDLTLKDVQRMARNPLNLLKVLFKAPDIFITLIMMLRRKEFFGDTSYVFYSVVNKKVSIFPTISKVRNRGHDGTGIHGMIHGDDIYLNQEIDDAKIFEYDDVIIKDMKIKSVQKFLNPSIGWFVGRIKNKFCK